MNRKLLVIIIIGSLISSQQVIAGETIFTREGQKSLSDMAMKPFPGNAGRELPLSISQPDSVESTEVDVIKLEDEDRSLYREIAAYTILTAAAVYTLYVLFSPDDGEEEDNQAGKPVPGLSVSIPLSH